MLPGIHTDVWPPSLVHPWGEGSGLVQMWLRIRAGCGQEARLPASVSLPRCSRVRSSGEGQAPGRPEAVLLAVPRSAGMAVFCFLLSRVEATSGTRKQTQNKGFPYRFLQHSIVGQHSASQLLLSPSVSSAVGGRRRVALPATRG